MIDIGKLRKDKGLTQTDLADILGVGQGFISQVENGKDAMPHDWEKILIDKYGISDISDYQKTAAQNIIGNSNNGDNQINSADGELAKQFMALLSDVRKSYDDQLRAKDEQIARANNHISELTTIIATLSK